mmetsp:Transcript_19428/g.49657  ORF Transcript_19428/g.49657 Transcript_19428/m.49657 type:complete len:448 (-) Transcript_19428:465-1808(-)
MDRASSKRTRSWEVDVSLDELADWDVFESFMDGITSAEAAGAAAAGRGGGAPQACGPAGSSSAMPRGAHAGAPMGSAMGAGHSADACAAGLGAAMPSLLSQPMGASAAMAALDSLAAGYAPGGGGSMNAAALSQSLYGGFSGGAGMAGLQALQALPMERGVSWGAELLPLVMDESAENLMDPSMLDASAPAADTGHGGVGADSLNGMGEDAPGRPMHKQRFVWTGDLHRRFEAAVNTLGIDQAKPQAISALMNCEGEGAPTRQNIKSHLQKYRLLMQKRARQGGRDGDLGGATGTQADSAAGGAAGTSGSEQQKADVHNELEQHLEKQEMNLKMQMDLQTKLHRQLLVQRQLQHQLEHCFPSTGDLDYNDRQRYQATLSLKNSLRERLTKHVMLQQEMLTHLDALVSNEASKIKKAEEAEAEEEAEEEAAEAAAAVVDVEVGAGVVE